LLKKVPGVQECDARDDELRTEADYQKNDFLYFIFI